MTDQELREQAISRVIDASRCIRHWHDTLNGEGMVVSAEHVRLLWQALSEYDSLLAAIDQEKELTK